MKKKLIREAFEIMHEKDVFEELYAYEIEKVLEEEPLFEEPIFVKKSFEELIEEYTD